MVLEMTICSQCGQDAVVPIVYGLPGHQLMASAARGDVVLGGCEIEQDQPTHACKACGSEWAVNRLSDA